MTEKDLAEAKALAENMTLEEVRAVSGLLWDPWKRCLMAMTDMLQLMTNVLSIHNHDPNFPHTIMEKIKEFLGKYRTDPRATVFHPTNARTRKRGHL
jgi:hypothetical protein